MGTSRRTLALVVIGTAAAAVLARFVDVSSAPAWALRLVLATLAIGVLPGVAVTVAALPRREWTLTELVVVAMGASLAIVQLATIAAISAHIDPLAVVTVLMGGTLALAVWVAARSPRALAMKATTAEIAWWTLALVLAVFLYRQGAPYLSGEDYLHLGVARRLAWLPHPALDNIYFAPGVIYTYPFPAIHNLVALISRLGDIDTIFVYHKLRFLWGLAALASLVVVGRRVFGSVNVGLACGFTGLAFAAAGAFANVPPLIWGQLVPYSHASDVAMGTVLPLTLAVVMLFLDGTERDETRFLFTTAAGLILTLTIVHIRELIQLAVYLAAFLAYLLFARSNRTLLVRTAMLFAATAVIAGVFTLWQETVVTHVGSVVAQHREELVQTVRSSSVLELLQPPLPLLSSFVGNYETMFWGWNPLLLLACVPVVLAFRRKPLVWFVAASIAAYLVIIRFPLVGIPYIFVTYFEILFTPVRNVIFFLHLIAGAALFLLAAACTRQSLRGYVIAAAAVGALVAAWYSSRAFLIHHQDVLLVPVIAALLWSMAVSRKTERESAGFAVNASPASRARLATVGGVAVAAIIALVTGWHLTGRPAHVIHVRWADHVADWQRVLEEERFKLVKDRWIEGTSWSYSILDSSAGAVRALVTSPAVADTHEINRETFTMSTGAPVGSEVEWAGSRLPIIGTPAGFDLALIALVAIAVLAFFRTGLLRVPPIVEETTPSRPAVTLMCATVLALSVLTFTPSLSPLLTRQSLGTPTETVTSIRCSERASMEAPYASPGEHIILRAIVACAPTPQVMAWVKQHVPVTGIFAADTLNEFPSSVFFPQQYLGWSGLNSNFLNPEELFSGYLRFYRRTLTAHGAQPMFNARETAAERKEFVEALGITHVLVDPAFHDVVLAALNGNDLFEKQYDDGRWAVFRVRR